MPISGRWGLDRPPAMQASSRRNISDKQVAAAVNWTALLCGGRAGRILSTILLGSGNTGSRVLSVCSTTADIDGPLHQDRVLPRRSRKGSGISTMVRAVSAQLVATRDELVAIRKDPAC